MTVEYGITRCNRDWMDLGHRVANIQLGDNKDTGIWQLHKSGQFSVRSTNSALLDVQNLPINKPVWKLKIPLKVKNIYLATLPWGYPNKG